jgi:SAM-dependent methyltransferase
MAEMNDPKTTSQLEYTGERMVPEACDPETYWEHVARYRFACQYAKGKEILDIACGEGYGMAALLRAGAKSVTGVDISAEAVKHVRERYGADARVGDATNIPLEAGSVDLVVSFETIEHIDNPALFLKELHRVLRVGGTAIISTPNAPVYDQRGSNPYHLKEMDRSQFAASLREHFTLNTMYVQRFATAGWMSPRAWCAASNPWWKVRGFWRVANLVKRMDSEAKIRARNDRSDTIDTILRHQGWIGRMINPYSVRPERSWLGGVATYLVARVTKAT